MNEDSSTCLLTLYGDYCPIPRPVPPEKEADLYSAFVSKAASLGWQSTYSNDSSPTLWGMEDAHLEDKRVEDGPVAWVRVGLMSPIQQAPKSSGPLLPMVLCAREAVSDFGDLELNAIQFVFPIDAINSASVSLDSLDTWLYPAPPDSGRSLALTVSADTATTTIGANEAETLLRSPLLSGVFNSISAVDTEGALGRNDAPSGLGERFDPQQPLRAAAEVSRWGAKQSACVATAIAYALSQAGASGSVSIHIEALPT